MRERRNRFGLALETCERTRIGREVPGQHLDGDIAIELVVSRAVDFAHATGTEGRDDLVRAHAGTGLKGHQSEIIWTECVGSSTHCSNSSRIMPPSNLEHP